jgi:ATP-binding cassette subfamily B protein
VLQRAGIASRLINAQIVRSFIDRALGGAAARMFVRRAELYVFDDLSRALIVEPEKILWGRLLAADRRPPVWPLLTAVWRADPIIVMNDGRVEAVGELAKLLVISSECGGCRLGGPGLDAEAVLE